MVPKDLSPTPPRSGPLALRWKESRHEDLPPHIVLAVAYPWGCVMDGIHDIGGKAGYGSVGPTDPEQVFQSDWERTIFVMYPALAFAGAFNIDQFRAGIELMPAHDYLVSKYYEHWMYAMVHYGIEAGIFERGDLERRTEFYLRHPEEKPLERSDPQLVERLRNFISSGINFRRSTEKKASFAVGDKVRVHSDVSTTHTRRASYVRGRQGEVAAVHGAFPYPDANSTGAGECPQHLYTVRFAAEELWSESADVHAANYIDVWEPYLLPGLSR